MPPAIHHVIEGPKTSNGAAPTRIEFLRKDQDIASLRTMKKYEIDKKASFGRTQKRYIVVDVKENALRFLDLDQKPKTEYPISQIAEVKLSSIAKEKNGDKKVTITFIGGRKAYEVYFNGNDDAVDFCARVQLNLDYIK
jgi:hypothetical protein